MANDASAEQCGSQHLKDLLALIEEDSHGLVVLHRPVGHSDGGAVNFGGPWRSAYLVRLGTSFKMKPSIWDDPTRAAPVALP